jgi:integrase
MPVANSAPILSNPPGHYPRIALQPAQKPKLLDRLRKPLGSCHYSPRPDSRHALFHLTHFDLFRLNIPSPIGACVAIKKTPSFPRNLSLQAFKQGAGIQGIQIQTVQELLGHNDIKTTMIYSHLLNRGLAGVRSHVDGL